MKKVLLSVLSAMLVLSAVLFVGCENNGKVQRVALDSFPEFISRTLVDISGNTSNIFEVSDARGNGDPFGVIWNKDNVYYDEETEALTLSITKEDDVYYGGELRTAGDVGAIQYGYFGCLMKPSNVKGTASTFFTYTGDFEGNSHDEIDIEFLGKDTTKVQFNYFLNDVGGHEYWYDLGFDASEDFHHYGFFWNEEMVVWFVDYKPVHWYVGETSSVPQRVYTNFWVGEPTNSGIMGWMGEVNDADLPAKTEYKEINVAYLNGRGLELPEIEYVPAEEDFTATTLAINKGATDIYTVTTDQQTNENLVTYTEVLPKSYKNVYGVFEQAVQDAEYVSFRIRNNGTDDYVKVRVDVQAEKVNLAGIKAINEKAWMDGEIVRTDLTYGGSFFDVQPGEEVWCVIKFYGVPSNLLFMFDSCTREDKESFAGSVTVYDFGYYGENHYVEEYVNISDTYVRLKTDETFRLTATGSGEVVWTVENPNVVTVADGLITPVAEGTTTVYAACGAAKASCTVLVTNTEPKAEETMEIVSDDEDLAKLASVAKGNGTYAEETVNAYGTSASAVSWTGANQYESLFFNTGRYSVTSDGYIEYFLKNIGHTPTGNGETINGLFVQLYASDASVKVGEEIKVYKSYNAAYSTDAGNGWYYWKLPLSLFAEAGTQFDSFRFKLYTSMNAGEYFFIDGIKVVAEKLGDDEPITPPVSEYPALSEFTATTLTLDHGATDLYTVVTNEAQTENVVTYSAIGSKTYKNVYGFVTDEVKAAQYVYFKLRNNGTDDYIKARVDVISQTVNAAGIKAINLKAWMNGDEVYTDLTYGGSFFDVPAGNEVECIIKFDGIPDNLLFMFDSCTRTDKETFAGSITVSAPAYAGTNPNGETPEEPPVVETEYPAYNTFTATAMSLNGGNTEIYTVTVNEAQTENTIVYTEVGANTYKNINGAFAEAVQGTEFIYFKLKNNGSDDYIKVRADVMSGTLNAAGIYAINVKAWMNGNEVYTDLTYGGSFFDVPAGEEVDCVIRIDGVPSSLLLMIDSCSRTDKETYEGSLTISSFGYIGEAGEIEEPDLKAEETMTIVADEYDIAEAHNVPISNGVYAAETVNTYGASQTAVSWTGANQYENIYFTAGAFTVTADGYIEFFVKNVGHTTSTGGETINGYFVQLFAADNTTKVGSEAKAYKTYNAEYSTYAGNGWYYWKFPLTIFAEEGSSFTTVRFKLYAPMDENEYCYFDGMKVVGGEASGEPEQPQDPDEPSTVDHSAETLTICADADDMFDNAALVNWMNGAHAAETVNTYGTSKLALKWSNCVLGENMFLYVKEDHSSLTVSENGYVEFFIKDVGHTSSSENLASGVYIRLYNGSKDVKVDGSQDVKAYKSYNAENRTDAGNGWSRYVLPLTLFGTNGASFNLIRIYTNVAFDSDEVMYLEGLRIVVPEGGNEPEQPQEPEQPSTVDHSAETLAICADAYDMFNESNVAWINATHAYDTDNYYGDGTSSQKALKWTDCAASENMMLYVNADKSAVNVSSTIYIEFYIKNVGHTSTADLTGVIIRLYNGSNTTKVDGYQDVKAYKSYNTDKRTDAGNGWYYYKLPLSAAGTDGAAFDRVRLSVNVAFDDGEILYIDGLRIIYEEA